MAESTRVTSIPKDRCEVSPFLLVAVITLAVVKAVAISLPYPFFRALSNAAYCLLGDLSFIAIFAVGIYIQSVRYPRVVQFVTNTFLTLLLCWYGADSLIIARLNYRVNVFDIFSFAGESDFKEQVKTAGFLVLLLVCLVVYAHRFTLNVKRSSVASAALVLLIASSIGLAPQTRLATSLNVLRANMFGGPDNRLAPYDLTRLGADTSLFLPQQPPSASLVVLVIIESFSSVDSQRTSGIFDRYPRFDEISKKGRLFTNFFANHTVTEGGLTSLFIGNPPIVYPGAPVSFRHAFWEQDSVVRSLKKFGYHTALISSGPMTFREKSKLLTKFGFDEALGVAEVARFRESPKFTFGAAADGVLYDEVLARLAGDLGKHKKLLLVVETTSTHLPFIDPLGRESTEDNITDYADSQFARFYGELVKRRLLDDGQLIVTGDHRKMLPVTVAERRKYGPSAEARVPLLLLGKDVQPGIDERLFQQADLFRYLPRVRDLESVLSTSAIFVEPYTAPLFGTNPSSVRIFTEGAGYYSLRLQGSMYAWNGDSMPPNSTEVERDVAQRFARLQYCLDNQPACSTGKRHRWFYKGNGN